MHRNWKTTVMVMLAAVVFSPHLAQGVVEVGPYVQFTDPYSAVVRWETDNPGSSTVEYGTTESLGESVQDPTATTAHEITINNLKCKTRYYYRVSNGDGGFTQIFWPGREYGFDTAINFTLPDCSGVASPYTPDSLTTAYEDAADRIIAQTGIKKGYCLVYGCGEGRLAFELAKRSDLVIIGVDTDAGKIDTAREKLLEAGVYGARVTAHHISSLSSLPFTKYFFNLIVSDRMISDGNCPGSAAEMFGVLRPAGSVAYLGQPTGWANVLTQSVLESWLDAGSLTYTTTNDGNGVWATVTRDPLAGSGWWSHQYGTVNNNSNSYDTIGGADSTDDFDTQWFGLPGADSGLNRHSRMPPPVAANGRLYHQGFNRIMAIDSYNGAMLWSLEVPYLRRVNVLRDASNMCADDDAVYIAVKDKCWRLDGDTGLRTHTYAVTDPTYDYDWGCVFRLGDKLYGSAVIEDSSFTGYWGDSETGIYEGYQGTYAWQSNKVISDKLFAFDKDDDSSGAWTYDNGVIINSTICLGGGRLYFIESRNPAAKHQISGKNGSSGTESALWQSQYLYLVALNPDTGGLIWEENISVASPNVACWLLYSSQASETLVLESSSSSGEYYLYGYDADDGDLRWNNTNNWAATHHGGLVQRAAIIGDVVYLYPEARYLSNGNSLGNNTAPRGACNTTVAIGNTLVGRNNAPGEGPTGYMADICMWDTASANTGTGWTGWQALRPSCWVNVITGGSMVLAPEGSGGCTCQVYINSSVGFIPKNN